MLTSPRPDRLAISAFYPADYQPFKTPHARPSGSKIRSVLKPLVQRLLDPKEHVLPPDIHPGKALEVGCGSGRYLAQLAAEGWEAQGLDPSVAAVDELSAKTDLQITTGTISSTEFDTGTFDLIVAVMVLEHLHEPLKDVSKLHSWLRPGGYFTGSVPNCGSWEFRFFGPDWYALQVPTHLFHFTPATLTAVLKRAGFTTVRVFHQRNVNNLMVHIGRYLARNRLPFASTFLRFPERGPRALRYSVRPAASLLAVLRQAGRISFLARKESQTTM